MENKSLLRKIITRTLVFIFLLYAFYPLVFILNEATRDDCQWVLFSDEEIKGRVIDAGTEEPVKNAIIIARWELTHFYDMELSGIFFGLSPLYHISRLVEYGRQNAKIIIVKTNKEGHYRIPSWIAFKPWFFLSHSYVSNPVLVVYKPGYDVFCTSRTNPDGFTETTSEVKLNSSFNTKAAGIRTRLNKEHSNFIFESNINDNSYSTKQRKMIFKYVRDELEKLPKHATDELLKLID